jgi:hypothetical protein
VGIGGGATKAGSNPVRSHKESSQPPKALEIMEISPSKNGDLSGFNGDAMEFKNVSIGINGDVVGFNLMVI